MPPSPRACNIDIVNPSLRSWHRIKRRIAQSTTGFGDPPGKFLRERNIPVGGGINTDVGKKLGKDTRELSDESTLGTEFPCLKKDRLGQGGLSFAIAIIEPALRYREDTRNDRACRCRLEYPVHQRSIFSR